MARRQQQRRSVGSVRQLSSGRWQARYVGPDGERHVAPTTYLAKIDAEGWLSDERRYLERVGPGGWVAPGRRGARPDAGEAATVRTYSVTWLQRRIRPTTREKYDQALRLRVLPVLGDVPLASLGKAAVGKWWRELDHDEHPRACDLAYQALRALCNAALAEDLISANPCAVRGAGGASARRQVVPLTPAQVAAAADAMPAAWRIGVLLAAWTSLRSGEIRELRRRDLDLDAVEPVVRVRRGVVRAGGQLVVGPTKTDAGARDVNLSAPLVAEVRQHLREHAQLGPDGLLVWSPVTGGQIHDASWGRAWRRAAKAAGVEGHRFHDLRHTGLTYAAIAGATVRELQQMAGHTTPAAAMRYQEVANGRMAELAGRLGKMMEAQ